MAGPNWAKLFKEGRCKAVGLPWTEEEAAARALDIPANYVRSGILTVEDYEKALAEDKKKGLPLDRMETRELIDKANELGLDLPSNTPDSELRYQILATGIQAKEKVAKKAPKKAVKKVAKKEVKSKK